MWYLVWACGLAGIVPENPGTYVEAVGVGRRLYGSMYLVARVRERRHRRVSVWSNELLQIMIPRDLLWMGFDRGW